MIRHKLAPIFPLCAVSLVALLPLFSQQKPVSFLIVNAQLADGTGAPLRHANVRIAYSRILGIGDLKPEKEEPVIDAKGLVLAPGFIAPPSESSTKLRRHSASVRTIT
jgi:N-acyl-D-amino-acid deacylase